MVDEKDPHFALGREHGRDGAPEYEWSDAELQRRYDLGYRAGRIARAFKGFDVQEIEKPENLTPELYRQLLRLAGRQYQ